MIDQIDEGNELMEEVGRPRRSAKPIERLTYASLGERIKKKIQMYALEEMHNISENGEVTTRYGEEEAPIIARLMEQLETKYDTEYSFIQQYPYKQGLKKFGEDGKTGND